MSPERPKNQHLLSPNRHQHQRTESASSHNYSVLDFYDCDTANETASFCESQELANTPLVTLSPIRASSEHTPVHTLASARESKISAFSTNSAVSPSIPVVEEARIRSILKSDTDMYGFKKNTSLFASTSDSYNKWFERYSPHFINQKKKWALQLKAHGLASQLNKQSAPERFPPKSDKIKKLVRRGIPPEWRGNAWFFYAGGHERLNKNVGLYSKIVADTEGMRNKDTEVIERDLHRTFPDNIHFRTTVISSSSDFGSDDAESESETAMISSLRRVLTAFAQYQPQIGYCQSLNFLAGLLLLFMSEEHAFWMLVIMTERIIPKVHSANLEGVHTDQGVLMMCIKEYIPKLWSIIGRNYDGTALKDDKILTRLPPLTLVTSSWFMSVFIGILPIESVLRIWDIIWYEGSKTIFRVSLTLCRLCFDDPSFQGSRDTKNCDTNFEAEQIELFQFIQNHPKKITDPNMVIDLCFKKIGGYGYGFLSQDEINKCREFVAYQRSKLLTKKGNVLGAEISDSERDALAKSGAFAEDDIHDVYGFNKSIMSGVAWNRHISGIMKKKFAKRG